MKLKTNKTVSKRLTLTKNKKVLHRTAGQDHFNARETGNTAKNKRRDKTMGDSFFRVVKSSINK